MSYGRRGYAGQDGNNVVKLGLTLLFCSLLQGRGRNNLTLTVKIASSLQPAVMVLMILLYIFF